MFKHIKMFSVLCAVVIFCQVVCVFPLRTIASTIQEENNSGDRLITAYNYGGHSYYTFSGKAATWQEAQTYCQSLGGYLAVINDEDENNFLFSLIQQQGYENAFFGLIIEYSDLLNYELKWENGNSAYMNLNEGKPTNYGRYGMFYGSSTWGDGQFSETSEFICEWDYEDASVFNLSGEAGNKVVYNGHSYSVYNNVVETWEQARLFCEKQGGYLAVINDADENIALFNMIRSLGYENVYFGYTDRDSEGNWNWVNNDSSNYVNWGKTWDEPNGGENENYAMFYQDDPTGEWNDGDFGEQGVTVNSGKAFICEWDTIKIIPKEYEDNSFDMHYTGNNKTKYSIHLDKNHSIDSAVSYWHSTQYNQYLAYVLSALASSAYTPNDVEFNLNSLGFSNYRMFNYYNDPVNPNYKPDSCAFSIAQKTLSNGEKIVLIPIRGSYGELGIDDLTGKKPNSDWTSDFNIQKVNDEIVHVGFSKAKDEVIDKITTILGEIPTSGVRFVITGHSRGAGIANLLSKELIDMGVPQNNVFDYNFACPDVAKDRSSSWNPKGRYDNIFNIGVAGDPVTVIPGCLGNMIEEINPDMIHYKYGNWGKYGQSRWVCLDWTNAPTGQTSFGYHAHEVYVENMAMEAYFSEMKTWKQMKKTEYFSVFRHSAISIFCPVSAELVDSEGQIIASITNEEVFIDEKYKESVVAWAEDDEKFFILFNIPDYSLNMIGTDYGSMDCSITTLVNGQYQTSSGAFYENIDLYDGKTMKIDVNATSNYQGKELKVLDDDAHDNVMITPDYFKAPSIYGDMNKDNLLHIADAVLLCLLITKNENIDLSNLDLNVADVNCDGFIDALDISELLDNIKYINE